VFRSASEQAGRQMADLSKALARLAATSQSPCYRNAELIHGLNYTVRSRGSFRAKRQNQHHACNRTLQPGAWSATLLEK
jgi:hypothetical protein